MTEKLQLRLNSIPKFDLKFVINAITVHLKRLDQIVMRPDAFTSTDYVVLMIQSEKKEKKPGFQERIFNLESMLENVTMVNEIRAGESVLSDEQSRFRSIDLAKGILKRAIQLYLLFNLLFHYVSLILSALSHITFIEPSGTVWLLGGCALRYINIILFSSYKILYPLKLLLIMPKSY